MVDVGDENLRCTHHSPYDHPLSITENFLFSYFLSQKMLPLQLILPDFFFCLGFWPRLFDILCCDVIPRSQQFHEFWFEAAYFFKLNVLRHHKKKPNLSFLKISGTEFPARFGPIPARFVPIPARFVPIPAWGFFQQIFIFCPMCVVFAMHTGSCRRLYQPQFTPFDPNCNTCLCCQRVLKLPIFKIPPSGRFLARTIV